MNSEKPNQVPDFDWSDGDWTRKLPHDFGFLPSRPEKMEAAAREAWGDRADDEAPCIVKDRTEVRQLVRTSRDPNMLKSLTIAEKYRAAETITHCGRCALKSCFLSREINS